MTYIGTRNQISANETGNSTQVLLGISATYTGVWENVTNYTTGAVTILGTLATATGTLYVDLSTNGGTTFTSIPFPIGDITFDLPHVINLIETDFRIRYVNDAIAQTGSFSIQTKYSNGQELGRNHVMGNNISATAEGQIVKSVNTGVSPDGTYHNVAIDGIAMSTTALLADTAIFDSGILDLKRHTQVKTEISSSHDGVLAFTFYEDSAGTVAVRSLSLPYVAANGYQMYSAPTFGNYVRYQFTNTSGSTQTSMYYATSFITKSLSGQLLGVSAPVAGGMVANLGRNVIVGEDVDGAYHNVHTTRGGDMAVAITDSDLGFHAIVTPGGSVKVANQTHLVGEAFGTVALNTTKWNIDLIGTGTQDATGNGELTMDTGVTANSGVEIDSSDIARFIPANYNTTHHAITIPDGASYVANNSRKWGAFNTTGVSCNGVFYELDSGIWYVGHCLAGVSTRIARSSWNGLGASAFPINSVNANVYEIEYNAGSIIFRVNGNVMHREVLLATPYADNINFPVGMSNTNTGGSIIDVSMKVRAAAIYTLGKGQGVDRPYYIAGTTTGVVVKTGPGHLGRIIIARNGAGGGDATVSIYDAVSATNQIARIALDTDVTSNISYDITFNIGLYIVITGAGTLGTTITFD